MIKPLDEKLSPVDIQIPVMLEFYIKHSSGNYKKIKIPQLLQNFSRHLSVPSFPSIKQIELSPIFVLHVYQSLHASYHHYRTTASPTIGNYISATREIQNKHKNNPIQSGNYNQKTHEYSSFWVKCNVAQYRFCDIQSVHASVNPSASPSSLRLRLPLSAKFYFSKFPRSRFIFYFIFISTSAPRRPFRLPFFLLFIPEQNPNKTRIKKSLFLLIIRFSVHSYIYIFRLQILACQIFHHPVNILCRNPRSTIDIYFKICFVPLQIHV